jgi:hypothetical protein
MTLLVEKVNEDKLTEANKMVGNYNGSISGGNQPTYTNYANSNLRRKM